MHKLLKESSDSSTQWIQFFLQIDLMRKKQHFYCMWVSLFYFL